MGKEFLSALSSEVLERETLTHEEALSWVQRFLTTSRRSQAVWSTPEGAVFQCNNAACEFYDWLPEDGPMAEILSLEGWIGAGSVGSPARERVLGSFHCNGRTAEEAFQHVVVWLEGWVVDLTRRQFQSHAIFPHVEPYTSTFADWKQIRIGRAGADGCVFKG